MYLIMKKLSLFLALISILGAASVHAQWKPVPGRIASEWAARVNPSAPLPEYPRPQLTRQNWMNLNGLWQYTILPKAGADNIPASYMGNILVPFAAESSLSGVGKTVGKDSVLWYNRTVDLPAGMRKGKTLLHFGAVDWACRVYVNGTEVGRHEGGYDPFTFDITGALAKSSKQTISVYVWDPTDAGPQPAGKQVKKPGGIWYTPVTGIWQTAWLENVPETYIASTRHTPDIDQEQLTIRVNVQNPQAGDEVRVSAWDGPKQVAAGSAQGTEAITLKIPGTKLWSPDSPFLYDLKITVLRKGKVIDEAGSYFGMRKISMARDARGVQRLMLNNKFLFQYGPLDQGWWPDGLYTAPTDEALAFDVVQTKALGFNMIRKHIKVEPARWYYHADKQGILVWQDMPSGDREGSNWDMRPGQITARNLDKVRTPESEAIHVKEWEAIMTELHNYPSIVVWVPFNEAWGQFKTREITDRTIKYDPSRLVNAASGGNFFHNTGHILDIHSYPHPEMPVPELFGDKQALALGEFGGLGLPVEGHTWVDKGNWGYQTFKDKDALFKRYSEFIGQITKQISLGLSAAVYTQTTDVEMETNGLYTYDRKVLKFPLEGMRAVHQKLYDPGLVK